MDAIQNHILVCCSFRTNGTPQGICNKKGAPDLLGYIENQLADRGMEGVQVSSTGCLKVCDRGPAMVVYPQNVWYGNVKTEEDIDAILDAMEAGEIAEAYRIG
jgi:(2Fe-2S) ferredoxin